MSLMTGSQHSPKHNEYRVLLVPKNIVDAAETQDAPKPYSLIISCKIYFFYLEIQIIPKGNKR